MDGMLMFFEQDSYAFGRFLPGFLLPGPLLYNPRTDSFLTVSSARQLESYKWVFFFFGSTDEIRASGLMDAWKENTLGLFPVHFLELFGD